MTAAVPNRDICFIKTLFLFCEHGHFSINFVSHGLSLPLPSPNTIRVNECWPNSLDKRIGAPVVREDS